MKKVVMLSACLTLAGCGTDQPSEAEIVKAFTPYTAKKACASSVLFNEFPVRKSLVDNNQQILDIFVDAGLLEKSGSSYTLTALGRETYDSSKKGFCYTDSFRISSFKIEKELNDLPPKLTKAWYVSVDIAPDQVSDWVKNDELLKAASRMSDTAPDENKSFTVRVGKIVGENELKVIDTHFTFHPGLTYNVGW